MNRLLLAGLLTLGLAACGQAPASPAATAPPTPVPTTPPPPTPDAYKARISFGTAYLTASSGEDAAIKKQNSSDPATRKDGIEERIALHTTFDSQLRDINMPAQFVADEKALLTADVALESGLGTLAANTDNTYNYNQVFDTVQPLETTFATALNTLMQDLGYS